MAFTLTPTAWAAATPGRVVLAGAEPEHRTVDEALAIAAAALGAVSAAQTPPGSAVPVSGSRQVVDGTVLDIPAPDATSLNASEGYVFYGSGAAAAFPGDCTIRLVAVNGGEETPAEDALAWVSDVVAACREAQEVLA